MQVLAWVHVEADMATYHETALYQARQRARDAGLNGSVIDIDRARNLPVSPSARTLNVNWCAGLPSWSYSFAVVARRETNNP